MGNTAFALSKNEREIMDLLWLEERPLSRTEIIELSPERSWKSSSIHILLNQLLDKGIIKVDGFVKTGKNYGRIFTYAYTEEEYQVLQFQNSNRYKVSKSSALVDLVSTLVSKEDIDDDTLNKLALILEEKRKDNR